MCLLEYGTMPARYKWSKFGKSQDPVAMQYMD